MNWKIGIKKFDREIRIQDFLYKRKISLDRFLEKGGIDVDKLIKLTKKYRNKGFKDWKNRIRLDNFLPISFIKWIENNRGKFFCQCGCGKDLLTQEGITYDMLSNYKYNKIPKYTRKCYYQNNKLDKAPNWKGKSIFKTCLICSKKFRIFPSDLKVGSGKFCSRNCYDIYRKSKEV